MQLSILTICYLIGSVTFIIGLKMLSNPAAARKGNLVAAAGMGIAILATIFLYRNGAGQRLHNYGWIFGGILIGAVVGTMAARRVKMTAMPEMVSLFNGMGGLCAALISIVEFDHLMHGTIPAGQAFPLREASLPGASSMARSKIFLSKDNTSSTCCCCSSYWGLQAPWCGE
jgi:H+-translocating NAD(P) transhydrogenase subunit beta